jgi:hypothetical protein
MSDGPITLVDAEEFNRQYPEAFEIPCLEERENVTVNNTVKAMFTAGAYVERMWVRVVGRDHDGRFVGELDSAPAILPMRPGETVHFEPRHIMDLYSADAGVTT